MWVLLAGSCLIGLSPGQPTNPKMARPLKQVVPRFQYGIVCTLIELLVVLVIPSAHRRNHAGWGFTLSKRLTDNPELHWIP
jgi:hypothetical protein